MCPEKALEALHHLPPLHVRARSLPTSVSRLSAGSTTTFRGTCRKVHVKPFPSSSTTSLAVCTPLTTSQSHPARYYHIQNISNPSIILQHPFRQIFCGPRAFPRLRDHRPGRYYDIPNKAPSARYSASTLLRRCFLATPEPKHQRCVWAKSHRMHPSSICSARKGCEVDGLMQCCGRLLACFLLDLAKLSGL